MMKKIKSLVTHVAVAALTISISACSSTLAPEDDTTTEYVFGVSGEEVLAKGDKGTNRASDRDD